MARDFTARVDGVRDWEVPAPVAGWSARDVVAHLIEWLAGFMAGGGVDLEQHTSARDDPAAAWREHAERVQTLLDAPRASEDFTHPQIGTLPLEQAIDRFYTSDVFMHTWDLARATGQDDRLDPDVCTELLEGMGPMEEILRGSGQFGPAVPVPDDAPVQDRLIGFIGRDPAWMPPT